MDDFAVRFMMATLYVMIGGSILVWVLNYLVEAMEEISQMTAVDYIYGLIAIGIITAVAISL
jgi:hypothetical protein